MAKVSQVVELDHNEIVNLVEAHARTLASANAGGVKILLEGTDGHNGYIKIPALRAVVEFTKAAK